MTFKNFNIKRVLFFLFGCLSISLFASFPVETKTLLTDPDPEKFKLDAWGYIIGILTFLMLPYSLLLLFVRKKNFRGSLAWGWFTSLILLIAAIVASLYIFAEGSFM
jgi:hypothetical protein